MQGALKRSQKRPIPTGRWGVLGCAMWLWDDQKSVVRRQKGVAQHGIDGHIIEQTTRSELIELGVSEERARDVHQALQKLSVKNRDLGGAGGRGVGQGTTTGECSAFGGRGACGRRGIQ